MLSHLLALPVPVLLGEISDAVYMFHFIPLSFYDHFRFRLDAMPHWMVYSAYWLVLLVGAYLAWRFIERPCRHARAHIDIAETRKRRFQVHRHPRRGGT